MKKIFTNFALLKGLKFTVLVFVLMIVYSEGRGQLSITANGTAFNQNFDGIGTSGTASLPTGWKVGQATTYSAATATTTLAYGTSGTGIVSGTSTGGTINWANGVTGSSTDRAVGFLTTGTYTSPRSLFVQITNNTGSTISSFSITFDIEKYRSGSRAWDINFFSSVDGTTWTSQTNGDQSYVADANNTVINNPPTTISKSVTISGLSIANGSSYYLRWAYTGLAGNTNAQGLGIDNFSITATAAPSNSTASDIIRNSTFAEPTNIAYASYQSTNITNDGNSLEIAKFDIRDGGGTADGDALGTDLTAITFSLSNWANVRQLALYDGTTEISEVAVSSGTVSFTGLTGLTAADGSSKTLTVRASFNSTVTDNQQLQLTVTSATSNATGSAFATAAAGSAASSITGNANKIIVSATKLLFIQQPTGVAVNVAMSPNPTAKAVDANNNTDLDYVTAVTVASSGTMTGDPVSASWASNVATFSSLVHTVIGTGFQLTAASGSLTSAISNIFDVASSCVTLPSIITTVASISIATTTASSGGATLSVDAGCNVTEKGVCWGTTASPTIAGSKTSDGTGIADFTSSITGLTAATLYYVRAYASNSVGTSYGDEKTFRTLSLEPTAQQPASFTSVIVSASQIDLTFTAASSITNGGGYIILQKTVSAATGLPIDGNGYSVGATVGDAIVAAVINSSSTTAISITGLSSNNVYYFSIIPMNWDGANTATYNYKTSATVLTTTKTTPKIEPSNQPTALAIGTVTTANIPITWTAAVEGSQAQDGYLIKVSTVSVVDPVDGTSPADVITLASGSGNKNTTLTAYSSFTNWSPGTMYNFKVYSYTNSGTTIDYNLTSPATINYATLPAVVTGQSFTANGSSNATIAWTLPGTYSAANHSTLVFIKATNSVTVGTPTYAPSAYTANTIFGSGTAYEGDATASCVYNGDGTSVSITGLAANTAYYILIYTIVDASNSNNTNSYSATSVANTTTPKIEPTNQPTTLAVGTVTNANIPLTWTAAVAGSQAPDGYLIKVSTVSVVDPVDGISPADIITLVSGSGNKITSSTSYSSFTNWTAGKMYNFKVYSYTNSGTSINYNLTSPATISYATLPAFVTGSSFTSTGSNTATIAWTLPGTYSATTHSTLVFVKATNAITTGTPTNAPSAYTANTIFGSGTTYQGDASAYCVYNADGTSVAVSGLIANTTYQVLIYTVVDVSNSNSTNSYSAAATTSGITPVSVPFLQDFEGTTSEWTLAATGTNKWAIGSATNNGGNKALYISDDAGTSNAYNLTSTQIGTDASVRIDLTGQTAASLSFDWKSNGEAGLDYGEVYINTGSSDVLISGAKEFESTIAYTNRRISLTAYVGGIVTLKFRWVNDNSLGSNPPFAVDNVAISVTDAPAVTTTNTSSITVNSASIGGNITGDGGSAVTARGVCYATTTAPIISGTHTSDGTGNGSFTSTLNGLTDNTNYYVRAYATNSLGTSYGNEVSFTTLSVSSPTTTVATSVSSSGFTANWDAVSGAANYKLDVSTSPTFGTSSSTTLSEGFDAGTTVPNGWTFTSIGGTYATSGNFGVSSPSLKMDATNDRVQTPTLSGSATQLSFWIKGQSATGSYLLVEGYNGSSWVSIDNILLTSVTTGTTKTYNSGTTPVLGSNFVQFRFTYTSNTGNLAFDDISINYNASIPSFVSAYNDITVGSTSTAVTSLSPATTYYYRVRAVGGNSTSANSGTMSVTTSAILPAVSTTSPTTSITATSAVSGGNVTSDGGATITARGVCYGTSASPDISGNVVTATGTTGTFTSTLSGLTANTTYHVRAYATNSVGTAYGADISFVSLPLAEPSNHPTSFTATANSTTQIDLIFSAPSTVTNTAGYIILQRQAAAPSGQPTDGVAYHAQTSTISDGIVAAVVTNTATTSASITGLTAGTLYYFTIYPYNWDGTNAITYNYYTGANPATASATTSFDIVTVTSTTTWNTSTTGSETDIVVNNGVVLTLNTPVSCHNFTINSGGMLTINTGQTLTASGTITIEDGGSLIDLATQTLTATMKRNINSANWGLPDDGWHLLSSPVSAQAISGSFTPDGLSSNAYDFFAWDEANYQWLNQKIAGNNISSFIPGVGYLVAYQSGGIKSFVGNLNNVNVSSTLSYSYTTDPLNIGYNLLGNPYPSAIDWAEASWVKTNIEGGTAKVYDDITKNFIDVSLVDPPNKNIIPANQAFFVKATSAASFTIPANSRIHNGHAFYKSTSNLLILKAEKTGTGFCDLMGINFDAAATLGYDAQFDASEIEAFAEAPSLYSILQNGIKLSINTIPEQLPANTAINLNFKARSDGQYNINATSLPPNNFYSALILEDLKTNTIQNLNQYPVYNFTATTSDNPNRFVLHFNTTAAGIQQNDNGGTQVYSLDGELMVNSTSNILAVEVYNEIGQQLGVYKVNGNSFRCKAMSKVQLLRIVMKDRTIVRKIVSL
ncbi:MAG: hypothetical protein WCO13_14270 [Bacteroidota bacterium]